MELKRNRRNTMNNDFSFIVLSDKTSKEYENRIIYQDFPKETKYTESNIKFIMMELQLNNNTYSIDLKNSIYNYINIIILLSILESEL